MTNDSSTRRQFICQAGSAALGMAVGELLLHERMAHASEPIRRTPGHRFKFSLAAYSYRQLLTGKPPQLTLVDFIDDCARLGLEGTELTSYYFPTPVTAEYLRTLKNEAFRRGLDISGTAVGNDFCLPPGEPRDRQIAAVKQWIDWAEILGAPVIRIFSGSVKPGQSQAEAEELAISAMEECCDYAGRHGVFLALENHGGLTATADGLLTLVKAVKSPWFGVNLDTGNFYTDDPYGDLAKLAPYALNVQIKVVMKPANQEEQPTDFNRLATMLRDSGYRGYIVLEYEEGGDPRLQCADWMKKLRATFAAID